LKRSWGEREDLPAHESRESRARAAKRSRPMPKPELPKEEELPAGALLGNPKGSSGALFS
jgi:hypothetical protein